MRKFQVTVNGNTYEVDVEEVSGEKAPVAEQTTTVEAVMPATSGVGSVKVEAPMQGKIVDIKVTEGKAVEVGQVVVILEAMKMENEVVAPSSGTVASIDVASGQSVNAGDVILTLN